MKCKKGLLAAEGALGEEGGGQLHPQVGGEGDSQHGSVSRVVHGQGDPDYSFPRCISNLLRQVVDMCLMKNNLLVTVAETGQSWSAEDDFILEKPVSS